MSISVTLPDDQPAHLDLSASSGAQSLTEHIDIDAHGSVTVS